MHNSVNGIIGGITAGYNVQIGSVVYGVEGDLSFSDVHGAKQTAGTAATATPCLTPSEGCNASVNWMGTVRGRVGYAFDRVLPFVTGGLAAGGLKGSVDVGACPGCTIHGTRFGWTAGAGVEWAVTNNWSLKAEYLYASLQAPGIHGVNAAPVTTHNYHVDVLRLGANYKF